MGRHKKHKHPSRRRAVRWCIAIVLCIGGMMYAYNRASATLRSFTTETFKKFSAASISFSSIDYRMDGSFDLTDLSISPKERSLYNNTIFAAKSIHAQLSIPRLFIGQVRITQIKVQDFTVNVQYDADAAKWNAGVLAIARGAGTSKSLPNVKLERGMVHYSKIVHGVLSDVLTIPLDAQFKCSGQDGEVVRFHITTADREGVKGSNLEALWQTGPRGSVKLNGRLSSANVPIFDNVWNIDEVAASARYDANTINIDQFTMRLGEDTQVSLSGTVGSFKTRPLFDVKTSIRNLYHGPEPRPNSFIYSQSLLDNVGGPLCKKFFNEYRPSGRVDIELAADGNFAQLSKTKCKGYIDCKDVSILYYKFPYRLDAIKGRIDFTNTAIELKDLAAAHNQNEFKISGYSKNFGPSWDANVHISSPGVAIDQDVYNSLTTNEKKAWFLLSPSGTTAMDYQFTSTPGVAAHASSVTLDLKDVAVVYQNFPYPLEHLTGKVYADKNRISLENVVSKYDSRVITLSGAVHSPNEPRWDMKISARHIPLDNQFRGALPDGQRQFYNHFAISGLIDADIHVLNDVKDPNITYIADVVICNASLKYINAPFAFENIWASAQITPGRVDVKELYANAAGAKVKLVGTIWPGTLHNERLTYDVAFDANGLEITDDLVTLLPGDTASVLTQFHPQGKVRVTADLNNTEDVKSGRQRVTVECLGNSVSYAKFPYPLKDITGRIIFAHDQIELQNLCARAGDATPNQPAQLIKISGCSSLSDSGIAQGKYELHISDFSFDDRLANVLPLVVRGNYYRFRPQGRVDLEANEIIVTKIRGDVNSVTAKASVTFKNCGFMAADYPVSKLNGTLEMNLIYDAPAGVFKSTASLDAQTLEVKSRMLRNIHSDIDFDQGAQHLYANNICASLYGGRLGGEFELEQNNYLLDAAFDNVDLNSFIAGNVTSGTSSQFLGGKMSGTVSVYSPSDSNEIRRGKLQMTVRNMQVAKLGIFGKLLLLLKLTEPTDYAFDKMVANAYLQDKVLVVDQLDLTGKSLSLCGAGNLNFDPGTINLVFTAAGPRVFNKPSLLKSLTDGFVPVVLRVKVSGDIHDPKLEQTTLPMIKDTLEILGKPLPGKKQAKR